jgi:hypothetical protein
LFFGVIAMIGGAVLGLAALAALSEPDDISGAPRCEEDFGDDCVTERDALILRKGAGSRWSWIGREQRWIADVPDGAPFLEGDEKLELTLPRQPGRDELAANQLVQVVYYEKRPALVRLSSEHTLETDDHPRRYAPTRGYLGLAAVGGGAFAVSTAWRTGRRSGFWRRSGSVRHPAGPALVVTLSGSLGALAQTLFGATRWSGVVGATLGAALGGGAVARERRRAES